MGAYGADVEQLEGLARTLALVALSMEQTAGQVQSALQDAHWTGPAADQFRSDWTMHAQGLRAAKGTIDALASDLKKQAEDQRRASGSTVGASISSLMSTFGMANGSKLVDEMAASGLDGRSSPGETSGETYGDNKLLRTLTSAFPLVTAGRATLEDLKPSAADMMSAVGDHSVAGRTSIGTSSTWNMQKVGHGTWGDYDLGVSARLGAEAELTGFAGIRDDRLEAGFRAGVELGAAIEGHAKAEALGFIPVGVEAEARAGASADASGTVRLTEDGIRARLKGDAFVGVGAKIEGGIGDADYAQATAGAGARVGVGASFDGTADFSATNVELGLDVGAALLLGVDLSLEVKFNPEAIYDDVTDAIDDYVVDEISSVASRATDALGDAASDVSDAVTGAASKGFKKVGSAISSVWSW